MSRGDKIAIACFVVVALWLYRDARRAQAIAADQAAKINFTNGVFGIGQTIVSYFL